MQMIHVREKTGKDGMLSLRIPLGKPEAEYQVLVVVQPRTAAIAAPSGEWQQLFDAYLREVAARAGRYPDGFVVDDSRETIYEGRGEYSLRRLLPTGNEEHCRRGDIKGTQRRGTGDGRGH
jgi:hypothetical protein